MEKSFSIAPSTNKCGTLWPCTGPKAEKRIPSNLGGQFATQKRSKLAPSFFGPDSLCKVGLSYGLHIIECQSTLISPDFEEKFLNSAYLNNRFQALVCFFFQPCEVGGLAVMQQRTSSNLARG
jgi:hypothetical protein